MPEEKEILTEADFKKVKVKPETAPEVKEPEVKTEDVKTEVKEPTMADLISTMSGFQNEMKSSIQTLSERMEKLETKPEIKEEVKKEDSSLKPNDSIPQTKLDEPFVKVVDELNARLKRVEEKQRTQEELVGFANWLLTGNDPLGVPAN